MDRTSDPPRELPITFLPGRLILARGGMADYHELARFHYCAARPATITGIWTVRFLAEHRNVGAADHGAPRGTPYPHTPIPPDPRTSSLSAVAILSWPLLSLPARDRALGLKAMDPRQRIRFINDHVRAISRVVVHPRFRSLGLAVALVRHILSLGLTRYTEALALMARIHPLFELAGMTRHAPTTPDGPAYFLHDASLPERSCRMISSMPPIPPDLLLDAYCHGAFPMAGADGVIRWYTADPRGILPLDGFHVPRTLRQIVRQNRFDVRIDSDFRQTMTQCMLGRDEGSWINEDLIESYCRLHAMGLAHSVEAWRNGRLAGGLYGVSIGGAFFGESMFHRQPNASKVALVHLVDRLRQRGYELLDAQAVTHHLRQFGCIEVPAGQYMRLLRQALTKQCRFP